jgi:SAM-dependent methyltransferase
MRTEEQRFDFGANWTRFLRVLDNDRIRRAEESLCRMLRRESLEGLSFIDIGSGSGLFSLAAARLGASRIRSFDYDPRSVACTKELKNRFFPDHLNWIIDQGSVLDQEFLATLGSFDVVYSWGVLHHTGAMWQSMNNILTLVADGGQLYIAIYNDQGLLSRGWRNIKRTYNLLPPSLRGGFVALIWAPIEIIAMCSQIAMGHLPWNHWTDSGSRGMSYWHDVIDWMGGYPFEVAKPAEVLEFYSHRGFISEQVMTKRGIGCNEFVFRKPMM